MRSCGNWGITESSLYSYKYNDQSPCYGLGCTEHFIYIDSSQEPFGVEVVEVVTFFILQVRKQPLREAKELA